MKPDQLKAAVTQIVGDVEISALQVLMIGPDKAEIKACRANDGEWFQGIVHYDNPLRSLKYGTDCYVGDDEELGWAYDGFGRDGDHLT